MLGCSEGVRSSSLLWSPWPCLPLSDLLRSLAQQPWLGLDKSRVRVMATPVTIVGDTEIIALKLSHLNPGMLGWTEAEREVG